MFSSHLGEIAALTTAVCWTITALAFETAGKRVGSLAVNLIRLLMAFILISIYSFFSRGFLLPVDATGPAWFWLSVSGLIGFILGDFFLFQAFVEIGSRISMLIMSTVPPITAVIGFLILGERITIVDLLGMIITIAGISLVVFKKNTEAEAENKKIALSHPIKGVTYALLGALGQALGLVLSKLGMGNYNPFAATQIRIIAAIIGFSLVITVLKRWGELGIAFKDIRAMKFISVGAFFGPFIGVSMSLLAVQYAPTGVVSTITSITPILIIPLTILLFKEKILFKEIIGAIISVIGITILFL